MTAAQLRVEVNYRNEIRVRVLGGFAVVMAGALGGLNLATGERHGLENPLVTHFRLLVGLLDRGLAFSAELG